MTKLLNQNLLPSLSTSRFPGSKLIYVQFDEQEGTKFRVLHSAE